ncbi:MAG: hypothetical protein AB1765_05570 [Candidatus Hydrogenedentota bacterium]
MRLNFFIKILLLCLLFDAVSCTTTNDKIISNPTYSIVKSKYYYTDIDSVLRVIYEFIREQNGSIIFEDSYHIHFQTTLQSENILISKEVQYKILIFKDLNATKVTLNIFEVSESLGRTIEPSSKISQKLYKQFWVYLDKRLSY